MWEKPELDLFFPLLSLPDSSYLCLSFFSLRSWVFGGLWLHLYFLRSFFIFTIYFVFFILFSLQVCDLIFKSLYGHSSFSHSFLNSMTSSLRSFINQGCIEADAKNSTLVSFFVSGDTTPLALYTLPGSSIYPVTSITWINYHTSSLEPQITWEIPLAPSLCH